MIVLVCGSHTRGTKEHVYQTLDYLSQWFELNTAILQGGAKYIDTFAKQWALENGYASITMDAPWQFYSNNAGPKRNGWMLSFLNVSLVVAFDGDNGTKDMIQRAKQSGIPVYEN